MNTVTDGRPKPERASGVCAHKHHTLYHTYCPTYPYTHALLHQEGILQVGRKDELVAAFQVGGLRKDNNQPYRRNSGALGCVNMGQE